MENYLLSTTQQAQAHEFQIQRASAEWVNVCQSKVNLA